VELGEYFDLEVTDALHLPDIHGGSMRVFLTRRTAAVAPSPVVQAMLDEEMAIGMLDRATYNAFAQRVAAIGVDLKAKLDDLKARGLKIAGYGASARGNTVLTHFGIDMRYLDFLVDKNSLKHGLFSPNTRIPIKPVDAIEKEKPDVLFLLAWNFFDEIRLQQAGFEAAGGRYLMPFPTPAMAP
jgi:hypothetical protein